MRKTVRRNAGCLDALPMREVRVLVLRAGIGPGPALTRERTGDRLDIATRRVVRIERRGLRHLRAAASDGCGGMAGAGSSEVVATVLAAYGGSDGSGTAVADSGAATGSSPGGSDEPRSGVKGEFESGNGNGAATARSTPAITVPPLGRVEGTTAWLSIAAVLLGLLMLGYAVRRELRSGGPAPG